MRPSADSDSILTGPAWDYLGMWGSGERGRYRAAIALQQLDHIADRLGEEEADRAMQWFSKLHPQDQAAVWHALSGG